MPKDEAEKAAKKARKEAKRAEAAAAAVNAPGLAASANLVQDVEMDDSKPAAEKVCRKLFVAGGLALAHMCGKLEAAKKALVPVAMGDVRADLSCSSFSLFLSRGM